MQPALVSLDELFQPRQQYRVPLYQRPYVWSQEAQWEPLWDDVTALVTAGASAEKKHFLGAIVLEQQRTKPGAIQEWTVIDGQQRLTTLQLLVAAVSVAAEQAGAEAVAQRLQGAVLDPDGVVARLVPTNADRNAFALVTRPGGPPPQAEDDPNNSIQEAFSFFLERARESASPGIDADAVDTQFGALADTLLTRLQLVSINLDPDDDAQVIFETLNARGTELLASDLVKNALFRLAESEGADTDDLHDEVWQPGLGDPYWRVERRQGRLKRPVSELFLMHWLTAEQGEVVNATKLFLEFKRHVLDTAGEDGRPGGRDMIERLCADGNVFRSFDDLPANTPEARFFRVLNGLDTTTLYPVALQLFRAREVPERQRLRALHALESYLVRRNLYGLSTKNYNRLAAALVEVVRSRPQTAGDAIVHHLAGLAGDSTRWPRDAEVAAHLAVRPLYGWLGRSRITTVLGEIERNRRSSTKTEGVDLPSNLSIEHILPQHWEAHWPLTSDDDGAAERRDSKVHLLGNLTLVTTPLNSSLSNQAWPDKRLWLQQHSVLLLNRDVTSYAQWAEAEIDHRNRRLTDDILEMWPDPAVFDPAIAHLPEPVPTGELDPHMAAFSNDELRQLLKQASPLLTALLTELATTTDRRRYSSVADALGWSLGRFVSTLGGYSQTAKASFGGRRPYRVFNEASGTWWIWLDAERAATIRDTLGIDG